MQAHYLFESAKVNKALEKYPNINALLVNDKEVGDAGIEGHQKSQREIYSVLRSAHLEKTGFWGLIEKGLQNGWIDKQIKSKSHEAFYESMSEVDVMDFFDSQGFLVRPMNFQKSNERVSDMEISKDQLTALVEVYSPRDWQGKRAFERELKDAIHNLDVPYSFGVSVEYSEVNRQAWQNPFTIAKTLADQAYRKKLIVPIIERAKELLESMGEEEKKIHQDIPELNFRITMRFYEKRDASLGIPRYVAELNGYSGISEEGMYAHLMESRIRNKDGQRQAIGNANQTSILVIHAAGLVGWYHLQEQWHRNRIANSIRPIWDNSKFNVDIVAFTIYRFHDRMGLTFPIICCKETIDIGKVNDFFGIEEERVLISRDSSSSQLGSQQRS
jgi:hypothetical protein